MPTSTMQTYRAGGRTRHVANLVTGGLVGTAVAYTITATTSEPSATTDGYKLLNNGQRFLHVVTDWTSPEDGTSEATFQLWGYHSFSGKWGRLQGVDSADGSNNNITITNAATAAAGSGTYSVFEVAGIERVAVQCTVMTKGTATNILVYLGANSY